MKTFSQFILESDNDLSYHKKQLAHHKREAASLNKQIKGQGPYREETKPLLSQHAQHIEKIDFHKNAIAKLTGEETGSKISIEKQLKKNVSASKAKKRAGF